jgi:hypothetical protein
MTAKVCCRAQPFGLALNVIIVSVSSAEAIQPVRTDRYTLAHRRSPAARSNTAGHANTRPISVHTAEVGFRGLPLTPLALSRRRAKSIGPCIAGAMAVRHQLLQRREEIDGQDQEEAAEVRGASDLPWPGTNRVQTASPNTTQRRPTSTSVFAGERPFRPLKPWSASSQRRYINKRSTARPHHALAGLSCSYVKSVSARDQERPSPGGLVCRDGGASSRRPPGGLPPRGRAASLATTAAGW